MTQPIQGTLLLRNSSGAGELYLAHEEGNCVEPGLSGVLAGFLGHKVRIFRIDHYKQLIGGTQAVIISVVDGVGA